MHMLSAGPDTPLSVVEIAALILQLLSSAREEIKFWMHRGCSAGMCKKCGMPKSGLPWHLPCQKPHKFVLVVVGTEQLQILIEKE